MNLIVNGKARETREGSLAGLLREMGADPARVAALVNDDVVRRDKREARILREGDRVEVLTYAGGG